MAMESEAEAASILSAPDSVENKFKELEGSSVDKDLEELKRLTGKSTASAALPAGRPIKDAIDVELEEMRRQTRS